MEKNGMYGPDGNCSALQWADLLGLEAVMPKDRTKLVEGGFYTSQGHRIYTAEERTPFDTPHTSTRTPTVDMRV